MLCLNGRLLSTADFHLDPTDRGLLLGDGVYDTLRVYAGKLFRWGEHFDRLSASARRLGIEWRLERAAFQQALQTTLVANQFHRSDAVARVTLTRGPGPRGLPFPPAPNPTWLITVAPLASPSPHPLRVCLATTTRRNEHSPLANLKSLNGLDNVLARHEADERGFNDALLLNTAGQVAEASSSNVFIVRDGLLLTPPLSDGCLPGVTRVRVLRLARVAGLSCVERSLLPAELYAADEIFLTNSVSELRAVGAVEVQPIGDGQAGPVTRQLQRAYTLERDLESE